MMQKVKSYLNGSMEPEPTPERSKTNHETDLGIAAKTFNTLGIIAIVLSLILFPVIGFQITILLFGVMFIGMSILMKSQDEILNRLNRTTDNKNEEAY